MIAPPRGQFPGIYRRKIGDIAVVALSDGYSPSLITRLNNISQDDAEAALTAAFRSPVPRVSVNAFAVYSAGRLAIIDTGAGNTMGPTLGFLPRNMQAAGIEAAAIDTVLLTHMHPDHSNGLLDERDRRLFPNAEIVVHEAEISHWQDDAAMARATPRARERYFEGGRKLIAHHKDAIRTFSGGEVFPGVTAVPIAGHTPGHTAFLISSGGEQVLIWGDTVHHPDIQVRFPEVTMEFDSDPDQAIMARKRVFDMVATDRMLVAGMHMHFPGFGHLAHEGGSYRLVPEGWQFD